MQGCVAATGGGCFTVLLRRAFSIAWGHFLCGLYDCGFCFALNYDVGRVVTRLCVCVCVSLYVFFSPKGSAKEIVTGIVGTATSMFLT